MTRDDFIRMAREAGFETASEWENNPNGFVRVVVRFAALVETAATAAANARANTSWALMCEKMVAAEREACAKVCDRYSKANMESDIMSYAFDHCAATIRAKSET